MNNQSSNITLLYANLDPLCWICQKLDSDACSLALGPVIWVLFFVVICQTSIQSSVNDSTISGKLRALGVAQSSHGPLHHPGVGAQDLFGCCNFMILVSLPLLFGRQSGSLPSLCKLISKVISLGKTLGAYLGPI